MKTTKPEVSKRLEIIGWYGPIAFIVGFALVSFDVIDARSYVFQLLNLTGGISIAIISFAKKAFQPAVLNLMLVLIAIVAIISLILSGG